MIGGLPAAIHTNANPCFDPQAYSDEGCRGKRGPLQARPHQRACIDAGMQATRQLLET
jgi:hypothetical protein